MTREEQSRKNTTVIKYVAKRVGTYYPRAPSYQRVVATLNTDGLTTTRGNIWTAQRLRRMLQRNGIAGIYGLTEGQHRQQDAIKGFIFDCKEAT